MEGILVSPGAFYLCPLKISLSLSLSLSNLRRKYGEDRGFNGKLSIYVFYSPLSTLFNVLIYIYRGMIINLQKLHFVSFIFYSQPNKRVFYLPNQTQMREDKIFSILQNFMSLHFFFPLTKQSIITHKTSLFRCFPCTLIHLFTFQIIIFFFKDLFFSIFIFFFAKQTNKK